MIEFLRYTWSQFKLTLKKSDIEYSRKICFVILKYWKRPNTLRKLCSTVIAGKN